MIISVDPLSADVTQGTEEEGLLSESQGLAGDYMEDLIPTGVQGSSEKDSCWNSNPEVIK